MDAVLWWCCLYPPPNTNRAVSLVASHLAWMQCCSGAAYTLYCSHSHPMYGTQRSQTGVNCSMLYSSLRGQTGHHHSTRTTTSFATAKLGACQTHCTALSQGGRTNAHHTLPGALWDVHKHTSNPSHDPGHSSSPKI